MLADGRLGHRAAVHRGSRRRTGITPESHPFPRLCAPGIALTRPVADSMVLGRKAGTDCYRYRRCDEILRQR